MTVAISPASPKVRIRSELENCSAMNESPAVPWVSTQAGPDDQDGVAEGGVFVLARDQPVARGEGELHGIGEADHHDQRRHHVQEHVEPEIEPAERAERQQDGDQRRAGRDDHEGDAAEEDDGDQAAGGEADGVVDQPVALDRVADLKLHDRHAGELAVSAGAGEIGADGLADSCDDVVHLLDAGDLGSSASTISASGPSSESSLPRMISFDLTFSISSS